MLSIVYPGGQWGSNIRILNPGQTFALDVRKLRDSQEKGLDDKVVPLDATSGHVSWSIRGKKAMSLIGRAQTVDFSNGLASTYECQCVCPWNISGSRILPGSVTGFPGDVGTYQPQANYADCNGNDKGWHNISSGFVFSSSNPGVADWNPANELTATAIAPGETWLGVSWQELIGHPEPIDFGVSECVFEEIMAGTEALCEVQEPQVTFSASALNSYSPTNGNSLSFTATISPSTVSGIIRFEIYDISAYRGDAMNHGDQTTPGYDFSGSQSGLGAPVTQGSGASLVYTISTSGSVNSATVNVYSGDYGGRCKIRAFATFGETEIAATLSGTSSTFAKIPKDDNDNNLPDAGWIAGTAQINEQSTAPQSDNDNNPAGSGMNGDGFTDFEEYRGVTVRGTHRRLNPFQKDLFILSELPQGIGDSNNMPVTKHALNSGELDTGRIVNFNHTNSGFGGNIQSHFNQHGLRIVNGGLGTDSIYGRAGDVGTPNVLPGNIQIFTLFIRQASPPNSNTTTADPFDDAMTRSILGHEVGHGVNIHHCTHLINCAAGKFSVMLIGYFPETTDPTNHEWNNIPHNYDTADTTQIRVR